MKIYVKIFLLEKKFIYLLISVFYHLHGLKFNRVNIKSFSFSSDRYKN